MSNTLLAIAVLAVTLAVAIKANAAPTPGPRALPCISATPNCGSAV